MSNPLAAKATAPLILLLLIIAGPVQGLCQAQSESEVYSSAQSLFQKGIYEAAITEYLRFGWLYPQSKLVSYTRYKIGLSHLATGNGELGRNYLKGILNDEKALSNVKCEAQLTLAKSYMREGKNNLAELEFNDLLTYSQKDSQITELRFWKGWNLLSEYNFERACNEFAETAKGKVKNFYSYQASLLVQESRQGLDLPRRSPQVANWLSTFLPGAGQIYCGKIEQGLISAILNSTLGYLTLKAIKDRRYYEGSALYLFVWSRYYWGSRYNAERFAIMYNEKKKREYLNSLIAKHLKNLSFPTCPLSRR